MKRIALLGVVVFLSACGGGSSTGALAPVAPGAASNANFNPSSVKIQTVTLPGNGTDAQVLAVDASGYVYFGSTGRTIPGFCLYAAAPGNQCEQNTGTPGIYRYTGSAFTLTAPYPPNAAGNVSAIDATDFSSVLWASDYTSPGGTTLFSKLELGATGGTAMQPPGDLDHNFAATSNDIVSITLSQSLPANVSIWLGGDGPSLYLASVPANCQQPGTCDLFWLAQGPGVFVNTWAVTRTYAGNATAPGAAPNGSIFFDFDPTGFLSHTYTTSDVAVRIAGTNTAIWFTDFAHNAIGAIDATGAITEYPVPTPNAGPYGITVAADGAVWFTEFKAGKVARLAGNGHIDEFSVPVAEPFSIAVTPPGCASSAIWVGSIVLGSPLVEITPGS
jgi:hypothetical protein